jgi:hypothetical protein
MLQSAPLQKCPTELLARVPLKFLDANSGSEESYAHGLGEAAPSSSSLVFINITFCSAFALCDAPIMHSAKSIKYFYLGNIAQNQSQGPENATFVSRAGDPKGNALSEKKTQRPCPYLALGTQIKQIGLLFLNQGLESGDIMKMKSLLVGSGIQVKKIPLRLWSRSYSLSGNKTRNKLSPKSMYGQVIYMGLDSEDRASEQTRPFAGASAMYSYWINVLAANLCSASESEMINKHVHKGASVLGDALKKAATTRSARRNR